MSYLGDIAEDQAFSFHFSTRKDTGLPTTLSGTPVLSVYKDNNLTQTTTGPTLTADADGITGYNRVDMVTTDAFYVAGADYTIVITTGTVNSISVVGEVVGTFSIDNRGILRLNATAEGNLEDQYDGTGLTGDTFPGTQAQLSNIANVGSAVHRPAASYTLTTGTQSANTYTSTEALDGTRHEHTDDTGVMDLYYEFLIGSGKPSSCQITGYITGNNDDLDIYGYDWVATAWVQIGNIQGGNSTADSVHSFDMFVNMVGSGANLGKVRVRLYKASGLTSALLAIDQVFVAYSQGAGAYNGYIHINTNLSNTNTVPGVDGIDTNPVSTWAAALTLSAATNIESFKLSNGSAITLTGNSDNYSFIGQGYTLALNNQSIASAYIFGATTSGIGTGGGTVFEDCPIGNVTLAPSVMRRCYLFGTITNSGTGDWFINDPRSRVAGASSPVFNFGAAVGNTNLNIRGNSGGWQLEAMGDTGTDTASIEGWGQIIEGTCTGGTVTVRGHFTTSGITNLTLSDDARIDVTQVENAIHDAVLTGATHNIPDSHGRRIRNLQEFGTYAGGAVFIDTVNGAAGTTDYESGTDMNPVDNIADATTLAVSLGLKRFNISPGSSVTLAQTYNGYYFLGHGWTLALGGQDVGGSHFEGSGSVTGIGTGATEVEFHKFEVGNITVNKAHFDNCGFEGTVTLAAADYEFERCYSIDNFTPVFDYGAAVLNTDTHFSGYDGRIELQNMGQSGTDTASINGCGAVTINANCTGGTVNICGNMTLANSGSGTVNDDGRIDVLQINAECDTANTDYGALKAATAMTESYAADGSTMTVEQGLYQIWSLLSSFSIAGTTYTAKKLDGSTTSMTLTLDDGTTPTAMDRTT